MSISYTSEKIKKVVGFGVISALVVLFAGGIYKMPSGMASKSPISIIYPQKTASLSGSSVIAFANASVAAAKEAAIDRTVVASKKGTKYYSISCSGAKTISQENKITFPDSKAAEKAGYAPAKNCKVLNLLTK